MVDEGLLRFVEEAIEDKQIIVTYKWLSITKNISMNQAKHVLQRFVDARKHSGLNVYLCFIGCKDINGQKTFNVKIIKEEEKDSALKDYDEATFHVYGVLRNNADASLLYSCDYDICKKLNMDNRKLLGIHCDHVVTRSDKNIVHPVVVASQPNAPEVKNTFVLEPKKSGFSSFFSKQKTSNAANNNSDSGFLEAKNSTQSSESNTEPLFINKAKESQEFSETHPCDEDKFTKSKPLVPKTSNKPKPASKVTKTIPNKSQSVQKGKRKRVVESSSSSDESSVEDDHNISDDDLFESFKVQLSSKSTSDDEKSDKISEIEPAASCDETKENQHLNSGMTMTKVSTVKTYIDSDDEGFMVTERVTEVVNVPTPEHKQDLVDIKMKNRVEVKQEVAKKAPKGKKKPIANSTKQSTLNSFFTKK